MDKSNTAFDGAFLASSSQPRPSFRFLSYFSFVRLRWAEFSKPHICALMETMREGPIVNELIDSGVLIDLRRWLEKSFMVNRKHPYTKLMFASLNEIRHEEIRQMLNYRSMIHPFSLFCLYYQFIMSLVTMFYLFYLLPADLAHPAYHQTTKWVKFLVDMIFTLSIWVEFCIGFWDKENMETILNRKLVAKHYLKTFFVWDLLACLPSYPMIFFIHNSKYPFWQFVKWLSLLRMFRIFTIDQALDMFREYCGIPVELYVSIQIFLKSYVVVLCCVGIMAFLEQYEYFLQEISIEEDKKMAQDATFATIRTLFGVGKAEIAYTYPEAIGGILITIVSYVLQIWIMAKLFILWQRFLVLSEVGEDNFQQLSSYLKHKGLPAGARDDIYCYYEFRFQKRYYDESTILGMLSENLRREIPNYRLDRNVERIKFIRLLPNKIITKLILSMDIAYYCPGDIVFRAQGPSMNLYYIKNGTVALHDEEGRELCHLEDGSYYGDISVVINQVHLVTMTAISPCKIFVLRNSVLMQILRSVPDTFERVYELTRRLMMNRKDDWVLNSPQLQRVSVIAPDNRPITTTGRTRTGSSLDKYNQRFSV